jgi:hypothetical protein
MPGTFAKEKNMRICLFTIAVAALLLALAVAPNSMANGTKNKAQVTFSTPVYLGQATLTPSTSSGPQGPVEMNPWRARINKGAKNPQPGTPGPAGPTPNVAIAPGVGPTNQSFDGLNDGDQGSQNGFLLTPPDQGLCAGNGNEIEAVNDVMAFYDSNGNLYTGPGVMSLYTFFNKPFEDLISDPRCYYDTQTGRFFLTVLDLQKFFTNFGNFSRSSLLIGVSNDSNPLHGFGRFEIDTTDDGSDGTPLHGGCPCVPDQPLMGADKYGFYISTNEFQNQPPFDYNDVQIYAMSKQLLEGFVLGTVVHFNNVRDNGTHYTFSIQPSIAPDVGGGEPGGGTEFFLAGRDFAGFATGSLSGVTSLGAWAITGTSTLVNVSPSLTLSEKVVTTEAYNTPPNATQKNSSNTLQTDDDRIQEVMYEGGFLQAALSTGNPVCLWSTSSAIAWFVIQPTITGSVITGATKIKNGYVVGPTVSGNHTFLMYPNLAVNSSNVGVIAFSLTRPGSAGFFPSSAYIHYSEAGGTSGTIHIAAKGVAPYFDDFTCTGNTTQGLACRWGDYSWAVFDDLNPGQIWMATEYISGLGTTDANWATRISTVPVP